MGEKGQHEVVLAIERSTMAEAGRNGAVIEATSGRLVKIWLELKGELSSTGFCGRRRPPTETARDVDK